MLSLKDIKAAFEYIKDDIHQTPVLSSKRLNKALGHQVYFKAENFQKMGAFKTRGVLHVLSRMKEKGCLPKKIVIYSSGNYAQSMAWAAEKYSIPIDIYMTSSSSKVKIAAVKDCKARIIFKKTRGEIEDAVIKAQSKDNVYIEMDNDFVISGHGTAAYEALTELKDKNISAVFAPLGSGGLLAGTTVAVKGLSPKIKVFGAEPLAANDGARTLREGKIFRWKNAPPTIADGVKALSVLKKTLPYLKMMDGVYEIEEEEIIYWTQWISHGLKVHIEPTSALGMCGALQYLSLQKTPQCVLVILSGGNMDSATAQKVWEKDWLNVHPLKKMKN